MDAIWLSPFYRSPQADAGYDVADYRAVDPIFGDLSDADALIAAAHAQGLRVIIDLVPNHTSSQHPWFAAALAAGPDSPERARYIFRDGRGPDGSLPPNNWISVFRGPAWTRVADGQWYLHLFDSGQPDLNWDNPEVRAEFEDILRFWMDRGVDGVRVDVAHGLVKESGLPDHTPTAEVSIHSGPMWDQEGVHDVFRSWRAVLDRYPGPRILVAEAWVSPMDRLVRYVRADEMHQAFNFEYLLAPWRADAQRAVITQSLAATALVGATTTWVLSNHDVIRHATRLGYPPHTVLPEGIGAGDPLPDLDLGLRRARAATLLMLALPGSAYVYQGEELGLPEDVWLPDSARQDPVWTRSGHTVAGPGRLPGAAAMAGRRAIVRFRARAGELATTAGDLGQLRPRPATRCRRLHVRDVPPRVAPAPRTGIGCRRTVLGGCRPRRGRLPQRRGAGGRQPRRVAGGPTPRPHSPARLGTPGRHTPPPPRHHHLGHLSQPGHPAFTSASRMTAATFRGWSRTTNAGKRSSTSPRIDSALCRRISFHHSSASIWWAPSTSTTIRHSSKQASR